MIVLAVLSGGLMMVVQESRPAGDLVFWIFADPHAKTYRTILPAYEQRMGKKIRLDLIGNRALNLRLFSAFLSESTDREAPDEAEIEISSVGRYFRPPVKDIGFLPLNELLETNGAREIASLDEPGEAGWHARLVSDGKIYTSDGQRWTVSPTLTRPDMWIDRIVHNRFAPWTKEGVIFGVPHDVHPMTITYRSDLFHEAGVDLESAKTWREFQEKCLRFQEYWQKRGFPYRHAMELQEAGVDHLQAILLQRGINIIDDYDHIHLAEPKVAETIAFYAQMIGGPRAIGVESAGGMGVFATDLEDGNICALFTPDWRVAEIKSFAQKLSGKVRMMPLPKFDPEDTPTSTWGGTMIGISKSSPHTEEAWKLIEYLYLSETGLHARLKQTNIIPPVIEFWSDPAFHEADSFYGGQHIDELYIELARQIPARYVTSMSAIATSELGNVLTRAVRYARENGGPGLEAACSQWLAEAQRDLAERIKHGRFEK